MDSIEFHSCENLQSVKSDLSFDQQVKYFSVIRQSLSFNNAIIGGSYALWQWYQYNGIQPDWLPRDIDVFIIEADQSLFCQHVLKIVETIGSNGIQQIMTKKWYKKYNIWSPIYRDQILIESRCVYDISLSDPSIKLQLIQLPKKLEPPYYGNKINLFLNYCIYPGIVALLYECSQFFLIWPRIFT